MQQKTHMLSEPCVIIGSMAPTKDLDAVSRSRIRAWLWYYLRRREWTQQQLAKRIRISPSTLNPILSGKRTAGFDVAIKMHRALGRSLDDLIDEMPPEIPADDP